jgi:1,4-dihydroxy-2-naphthoate polyprenyltransferase
VKRDRLLSILSPVVLLALWEGAVALGWLNRIFYPPPSQVFVSLAEMAASGELLSDVTVSVVRVGLGFLLGGVPAIALGLLMGVSPTARALLRPIAAAIYPIPKIALLPLIIVVLGIGERSMVATIAVSVFFLVILNVAASVMQVDQRYFEVARSFGGTGRDLFWTVALPGSLPGIMASVKLGMGFALTLIVGVEFVGASTGLGQLIWQSYEVYAIDRMIAGLVTVALVGWLVTLLLDELEYALVPWAAAPRGRSQGRKASGEQPKTGNRARSTEPNTPIATGAGAPSSAVGGRASSVRTWFRAARPWSFTASAIPVLLGAAIAATQGWFDPWLLALTLLGSLAIHAGTNLVNDYYDHHKGLDAVQQIGVGGAIQRGELSPRQVLLGGLAAFAMGSAIGLYLVSVAGPFILWLGLASVLVGFFYTAGPFALAYVGLGEVAVFLFMGPVMVVGSYFVQARAVTPGVVLASLPVGFLVAAILHANNLRDLEIDRSVGKRTLATLLGRGGARLEYYALIGGTYLSLVLTVALGAAPWLTLVCLFTLPLALRLVRTAASETEPPALQPVLRQTALLHLRFGALLVASWAAAWALALLA